MVADPPVTAAAALEGAAEALRGAGVPSARRGASRLAEAAWGLAPGQARLRLDRVLTAEDVDRLAHLVARRATGEPLAYVTGNIGFRHLQLAADRRALLPRPETEGLVALVLDRMPVGVVADVCTGSGCIALSLAQEGRYDRVIGADASPDAIAQARENGQRAGLTVEWRLGDLLEPLQGESLDVLVANPPYLTGGEYRALDPAVRDWEPRQALESGEDGLDATRRLLVAGRDVVKQGGWIALEVDCHRAAEVASLAAEAGWIAPVVHLDLYDRARFVLARRSETS
ncbi:MAG: peptide chain release factor N(5)-glutamine methyltransferase [Gemmatimonadales bacterium]